MLVHSSQSTALPSSNVKDSNLEQQLNVSKLGSRRQPGNPFASLIPDQQIAVIPSFTLESGVTLHNLPLAYTTRGKLSANADNVMVICHALTGSADVSDWWGPLIGGPGRVFDTSRFFVVVYEQPRQPIWYCEPSYSQGW